MSDFCSVNDTFFLIDIYENSFHACSNHNCKGGTVTHTFTWDNWKYGMYPVNSYKQVASYNV